VSLILDALKKSEQERRRDKGPDLQTIHQPPMPANTASRSRTGIWLGVLVLVNCAAVGVWWWQRTPQSAPKQEAVVQAASPAAVAAPAQETSPPKPAEEPVKPVQEAAEYTRYAPASATAVNPASSAGKSAAPVQEISELPDSVRNTLPAMTFSFHVYSGDPQRRTIIINNRRLREGDAIDAGMTLQEITEDGVIIAMNDRRVHISVLSGW
jgi:general secretion pathway protein B